MELTDLEMLDHYAVIARNRTPTEFAEWLENHFSPPYASRHFPPQGSAAEIELLSNLVPDFVAEARKNRALDTWPMFALALHQYFTAV